MITCHLCQEEMIRDDMLIHLANDHAIPEDEISILEDRREIRRRKTNELLANWKEVWE